jgi:hypothetical protein
MAAKIMRKRANRKHAAEPAQRILPPQNAASGHEHYICFPKKSIFKPAHSVCLDSNCCYWLFLMEHPPSVATLPCIGKKGRIRILGGCQCRDFDDQIADCTLTFIAHAVLTLHKRFSDYETLGEVFRQVQQDMLALTLWERILPVIAKIIEALSGIIERSPYRYLKYLAG